MTSVLATSQGHSISGGSRATQKEPSRFLFVDDSGVERFSRDKRKRDGHAEARLSIVLVLHP